MSEQTCIYCKRELADSLESDTYHAIEGWETLDGTSALRWVTREVFACGACVAEHFVRESDDAD